MGEGAKVWTAHMVSMRVDHVDHFLHCTHRQVLRVPRAELTPRLLCSMCPDHAPGAHGDILSPPPLRRSRPFSISLVCSRCCCSLSVHARTCARQHVCFHPPRCTCAHLARVARLPPSRSLPDTSLRAASLSCCTVTFARSDRRFTTTRRTRVAARAFCRSAGRRRASASASVPGLERHAL